MSDSSRKRAFTPTRRAIPEQGSGSGRRRFRPLADFPRAIDGATVVPPARRTDLPLLRRSATSRGSNELVGAVQPLAIVATPTPSGPHSSLVGHHAAAAGGAKIVPPGVRTGLTLLRRAYGRRDGPASGALVEPSSAVDLAAAIGEDLQPSGTHGWLVDHHAAAAGGAKMAPPVVRTGLTLLCRAYGRQDGPASAALVEPSSAVDSAAAIVANPQPPGPHSSLVGLHRRAVAPATLRSQDLPFLRRLFGLSDGRATARTD